jgi:hypothetical protein
VLVLLLSDWSPVVAFVLLVSDWSPVVVVLSMVRLERPRRSTVGDTVELEPVIDEVEFALEPVIDEFTLELDPVTDGLEVEVALLDVLGEVLPEAIEPLAVFAPAVLLVELPLTPLDACASGMQSMWTGLFECSLAAPVLLSASLPACGCPSSLHSGLEADAVVEFALVLPEDLALEVELVDDLLPDAVLIVDGWVAELVALLVELAVVSAKATLPAPKIAATASALIYRDRIIFSCLLVYGWISCRNEGTGLALTGAGCALHLSRAVVARRGCPPPVVPLAQALAAAPGKRPNFSYTRNAASAA